MYTHLWRRGALALLLLTIFPLLAHAAENDGLLTDFGGFGNGGVIASVPLAVNEIALQADGKVVAIGVRGNTFGIARYTSNGQIDDSFGTSGIVMTTIAPGQQSAEANDVAIQPDGKIVVVGTVTIGNDKDFAVTRYTTDGVLDTTFSDNGILYAGFGSYDRGNAVGIDSFNRIIVGGSAEIGGDDDFAVMSLMPNGLFDLGFGGGDGRATLGFGEDERAQDMVIQPDDKIVLGGSKFVVDIGWHTEFAVARFNSNGSADTSFNSDGKRSVYVSGNDFGEGIALDSNGRIIVAGGIFKLARFYPSGALDPNFDGDGKLTTPLPINTTGQLYAVLALPDNKLLAAGSIDGQMALLRYNFDGTLDQSFDGDGKLLLDNVPDYAETAFSLKRLPDGRLLLAGGNVIVRLFADGTLDSGGRQLAAPMSDTQDFTHIMQATLAQPDGKIVSVGQANRGSLDDDIVLTRHLPNGLPDLAFGEHGARIFGFGATSEGAQDAVLQPDGSIIVVGTSKVDFQSDDNLLLARFRPDSSPDSSCAGFGFTIKDLLNKSYDSGNSVALQPDGKILVAGVLSTNTLASAYVARFNADCSLDNSFSGDGVAPLDLNSSVADVIALPDGNVLLVGSMGTNAYLARYTGNGTLDATFGGGDGIVTTLIGDGSAIQSAALQPTTGKILLAGSIKSQNQFDFLAMRYNLDGSIDSNFGSDGRTITDMGDSEYLLAMALRDDGEIALAGCTTITGLAVVALYSAAGMRDSVLTGDGISTFRAGGFTCIKDAAFTTNRLVVGGFAGHDTALSFALGVYALERNADGGTSRGLGFVKVTGEHATYAEGDSSALLTVGLSQTAAQTVTVQYEATGGTATNGSDYSLQTGTLSFAPGQTSQRISVPLINDTNDEPDETIVVTLKNPTNALLNGTPNITLMISDDDLPGSDPSNPTPDPTDPPPDGQYRVVLPFLMK